MPFDHVLCYSHHDKHSTVPPKSLPKPKPLFSTQLRQKATTDYVAFFAASIAKACARCGRALSRLCNWLITAL